MFEFRGETNKESQMLRYGLKASVNRKVILNVPYGNQARPSASPTQFSKTKLDSILFTAKGNNSLRCWRKSVNISWLFWLDPTNAMSFSLSFFFFFFFEGFFSFFGGEDAINISLFIFLFFFIFYIVVAFVIHWNETAMGLHVFPIPIPPPTSLSTWSL